MRCTPVFTTLALLELPGTRMQRPCCADVSVNTRTTSAPAKAIKICMIYSAYLCSAWGLAWRVVAHPAGAHLRSNTCMGDIAFRSELQLGDPLDLCSIW